jgi:hypothetical protein
MAAFSPIVLDDTSNDPIAKVVGQINANFSSLSGLVSTPNAPTGTPNSSTQTLFSPYDFGCKIDGINKSDITTKSASEVISSASHNFSAGDVGKLITIAGAGAAAAVLNASIVSVDAQGRATLSVAAGTTISGTGVATMGTNDTANFQACINAAAKSKSVAGAGGALIMLPNGIMVMSSVVWATNVSLQGQGAGKSILKHIMVTDAIAAMITNVVGAPYLYDIQFRNFEMDMEAATYGVYTAQASCIRIAATSRSIVDGCYLHGSPATTIAFDYAIEQQFTNNIVANYGRGAISSSQGGAGYGCAISGATVQSFLVTDNVFIGDSNYVGVARATYAVFFEEEVASTTTDANAIVNDNIFIGTATLAAIGDCGLRRFECCGNHITSQTNNTGDAITVRGGTTGFAPGEQGIIAGNVITAITGSGISISYAVAEPTGQLCGYLILGNRIQAPTGHGIKITANASVVLASLIIKENFIQGCTFTGVILLGAGGFADINIGENTIINNGAGGSGITTCGVAFEAAVARLSMMGNDIYDNGAGTQTYAIGVNTSIAVTGAWIFGNNFKNNATGAINLIGGGTITGTIASNNGYNPVGASSGGVGASPWTFTAGNSPGTLYISSSGTITAVTQNGTSIFTQALTTQDFIIPFNAGDVIIVTYTGTLTGIQMVN